MANESGRVGNLQAPPGFPILVPSARLFTLKSRIREYKWHDKVIPVRVTREVSEMQIIPLSHGGMPCKGLAGIVRPLLHRPIRSLQRDTVWSIDQAEIGFSKARHSKKFIPGGPIADEVGEFTSSMSVSI